MNIGAMILALAITSALLIIGVGGTVIGITMLVYPSEARRRRPIRKDKDIAER